MPARVASLTAVNTPDPRSADAIAAATAPDRDRWADTLRVGSLLVVVLGHWFMVAVTPEGEISNALKLIPALQPATWLLQVMPVFFLVGGVAHAHTLESLARKGVSGPGSYAAFLRGRAARLLRPTLVFLGVWLLFGFAAHLLGWTRGPGGDGRLVSATLVMVPQLLWFIGIYLGIAAFAPAAYRWHQRWGLRALLVLVALAVLVDVVRFGLGVGIVGNLNFLLVWLALHQCGFAWRDGSLTTPVAVGLLGVGAVGLVLAVTRGPYPVSMVGLPGDEVSNMAPPTAALLAQGLALIGIAALLRGPMGRVLARPRVWRWVVLAGAFAMTAFLWHLTALLLVLLSARALRLGLPEVGTSLWWWTRPVWFAVLAVPTAALVAVFARFDRGPKSVETSAGSASPAATRLADWRVGLGAFVTVFGVLMVSIAGVDLLGNNPQFFLVGMVTPWQCFAVLLAGIVMLGGRAPTAPEVRRTAP